MQKIPAIIIFVLMLTLPLTGFAGQKDYLTPAFWTSATVADVNTAFKNSADLKATDSGNEFKCQPLYFYGRSLTHYGM